MSPDAPKLPTPAEYIKNRIGTLEMEILSLLELNVTKDARIAELAARVAELEKPPE